MKDKSQVANIRKVKHAPDDPASASWLILAVKMRHQIGSAEVHHSADDQHAYVLCQSSKSNILTDKNDSAQKQNIERICVLSSAVTA
jgi:hypothetical protein